MRVSLTKCLLLDGTIYFIALLAINVTQLLTTNLSADESFVGTLMMTLPLVLINCFIINLCQTAYSEMLDYSVHISDLQQGQLTLHFTRPTSRLGNVEGTLQSGWGAKACDDEDAIAGMDQEGHCESNAEL
ncbi:uncharacterized protein PHACADRAFT_201079 [Phanerochaete carnosa HHB-10118-sp]|uniref:Uncharacterized protein n=1 Tax=Phanerochaete carnosa (strain HHB-10118-sp) TaxID=650164 RepID=K5UKR7_PHACS|nr:uncharacterized protein PHACADRAFT_201079 [Phanerochaete carnosa HHB-10118-sp]EKM50241.1 hypothetical protein PHACADRAFT_201079 [Phanerochaete carnosa HHB-10118-sp]